MEESYSCIIHGCDIEAEEGNQVRITGWFKDGVTTSLIYLCKEHQAILEQTEPLQVLCVGLQNAIGYAAI